MYYKGDLIYFFGGVMPVDPVGHTAQYILEQWVDNREPNRYDSKHLEQLTPEELKVLDTALDNLSHFVTDKRKGVDEFHVLEYVSKGAEAFEVIDSPKQTRGDTLFEKVTSPPKGTTGHVTAVAKPNFWGISPAQEVFSKLKRVKAEVGKFCTAVQEERLKELEKDPNFKEVQKWVGAAPDQERGMRQAAMAQAVRCTTGQRNDLNFTGFGLTNLPPELFLLPRMETVKKIDLSGNQLQELPDTIGKLEKLESLNLSKNRFDDEGISDLVDNIETLERLKSLNLSHNSIEKVPSQLFQLSIKRLNLSYNQLAALPGLRGFGNNMLEWCDLSHNKLEELPEKLCECAQKLQWLNVSGNQFKIPSSLEGLPEAVAKTQDMFSRWDAWIKACHPREQQKRYAVCKQMDECLMGERDELDFNDFGLTALPAELFQWDFMKKVKKIDLSHNQLTELPPGIDKLEELTELDLSHNQLAKLRPEIFDTPKLEELNLSYNALKWLTEEGEPKKLAGEPKRLKKLDLSHNNMQELTDTDIQEWGNLEELLLNNNDLFSLPKDMRNLQRLTTFNIIGADFKRKGLRLPKVDSRVQVLK